MFEIICLIAFIIFLIYMVNKNSEIKPSFRRQLPPPLPSAKRREKIIPWMTSIPFIGASLLDSSKSHENEIYHKSWDLDEDNPYDPSSPMYWVLNDDEDNDWFLSSSWEDCLSSSSWDNWCSLSSWDNWCSSSSWED